MSEDVILVVDFNSVCRFCLQSNGTLSGIFSGGENPLVSSQLECFTDIKVEQDDSFPSKICHKCRYKIEFCFEFREMVLRTQKALADNINNESEETKYDVETLDSSFETEHDDNKHYTESKKKAKKSTTHQNAFEDFMISNKLDPKADMNNIFILHQDQPSDEDNMISPLCGNSFIENLQEQYLDNSLSMIQIKSKKNKSRRYEKKIKYPPFSKMKDYPSMLTASRRNQCLLCLEKCDNPASLKEHVNKHIEGTELEPYYIFGERDISCKACHKIFGYRFSFLTHQREHLNLKPFVCHFEGCEFAFYSNSSLRQHLPIHGDKRFICSMCAVGFKRKSDLKAHEIIHKDAGMVFSCPICKLTCKNRLTLAAHVRKHCNQPRFKCSDCPKSYFSRSELDRHANIHTGEKGFRCAACPSAYFSRAALVRHERGHTGERRKGKGALGEGAHRKCPLCPQAGTFGTWQEYKLHMKGHSSYDFPYRCPHCQKGYSVKNSLTKHLSFCNSDPALQQLQKSDETAHQYDMKNATYVRLLQPLVKEEEVDQIFEGVLHGRQELDSIMVNSGNGEEPQQLFIVDMIQEQIEE